MRIIIEFFGLKRLFDKLKKEEEYPTIDCDAILDYIIDCYIKQYHCKDSILVDLIDNLTSVGHIQEITHEKLAKDISDVIASVFDQLYLFLDINTFNSSYKTIRIFKNWRNIYVLELL